MTSSLQVFEAALTVAQSFTFVDADQQLTLHLDPVTYVGRGSATVLRRWQNEEKTVQMSHATTYMHERFIRSVCIQSEQGIISPDVVKALAEMMMPDDTYVVEIRQLQQGMPPAVIFSDHPSIVFPGQRKPGS